MSGNEWKFDITTDIVGRKRRRGGGGVRGDFDIYFII